MSVKVPFCLIGLFVLTFTASAQWTKVANYGGPATDAAFSFVIDGKGYVGGGTTVKDFWEYDPATNTWKKLPDLPGGARGWSFGFAMNGKGYFGCGDPSGTGSYHEDVWEYDPSTNTWNSMNDFPGGPRDAVTCFVIGSKAYIGCGYNGVNRFDDMYEFDPATDTWTPIAPYPGGSILFSSAFVIGNKAYVGVGSHASETNEFYEFDPSLPNPWTKKADFAGGPRQGTVGFAAAGKGYIGLGLTNPFGTPTNYHDFWEYDPAMNSWSRLADGDFPDTMAVGWSTPFVINDVAYVGLGVALPGLTFTRGFYKYTFGGFLAPNMVQSRVNFGNVATGTKKDTLIEVRNDGKADLTITSITILSNDDGLYSIDALSLPLTLKAGEKTNIGLHFAPKNAVYSVSILKIVSNASNGAELLYDLRGTGVLPKPAIEATPTSVNFGEVNVGAYKDSAVSIKNIGGAPLIITAVTIQNDPSGAYSLTLPTLPLSVDPENTVSIPVRFAPKAAQNYSVQILIVSNADNRPQTTITPFGKGLQVAVASIELNTAEIIFGETEPGAPKQQPLEISNTGTTYLTISALNFISDSVGVFSAVGATLPLTVPAGNKRTLQLQYAPQWAGMHSGTLRITSNASNAPTKDVLLSGSAVAKTTEIGITIDRIRFAGVPSGTSKDTMFEIRSAGTEPLEVTGVDIIEDMKGVFSFVGVTVPFTLASSETRTVTVRFRPMEEGTFQARVRITSNAQTDPEKTIALEGVSTPTVAVDRLRDVQPTTVEVFPNPVSAGSTITCKITATGQGVARLALVDLLGRVVASQETTSPNVGSVQFNLDRYSVSPGLYYLLLSNGATHTRAPLTVIR